MAVVTDLMFAVTVYEPEHGVIWIEDAPGFYGYLIATPTEKPEEWIANGGDASHEFAVVVGKPADDFVDCPAEECICGLPVNHVADPERGHCAVGCGARFGHEHPHTRWAKELLDQVFRALSFSAIARGGAAR